MVEKYNIRTDLALEEKERFESDQVEVQGVVLEEEYDKEREIRVTTVRIETENGAKTMGKPVGTYLTIEAPNLSSPDEGIHREVSEELAKYLIEVMEKSTHNRRERPVYGHRGGSRGRFYYRITTFEERPWDARDPH